MRWGSHDVALPHPHPGPPLEGEGIQRSRDHGSPPPSRGRSGGGWGCHDVALPHTHPRPLLEREGIQRSRDPQQNLKDHCLRFLCALCVEFLFPYRSPSLPLISEARSPPTRSCTRAPHVITSTYTSSSACGAPGTQTSIASKWLRT